MCKVLQNLIKININFTRSMFYLHETPQLLKPVEGQVDFEVEEHLKLKDSNKCA